MKIEKLTKEQEAQMSVIRDEYLQKGLATGPCDRAAMEKAVALCYMKAKLAPPKEIEWYDSPLAGSFRAAMLANGTENPTQSQVSEQTWRACYGQHDAGWLSFYAFFERACDLECTRQLDGLQLMIGCGWWWAFEDIAVLTERPVSLHRDNAGRLHSEDEAAISYSDGFAIYVIHGVRVPSFVVLNPEEITVKRIKEEGNSEVRRIMIQRYGYERYYGDVGARVVDQCGEDHPIKGLRTARLLDCGDGVILLDMLNSTPEPDGTVKRYMIAIDGERYNGEAALCCHAAMASTWRVKGDETRLMFENYRDYKPAFES